MKTKNFFKMQRLKEISQMRGAADAYVGIVTKRPKKGWTTGEFLGGLEEVDWVGMTDKAALLVVIGDGRGNAVHRKITCRMKQISIKSSSIGLPRTEIIIWGKYVSEDVFQDAAATDAG